MHGLALERSIRLLAGSTRFTNAEIEPPLVQGPQGLVHTGSQAGCDRLLDAPPLRCWLGPAFTVLLSRSEPLHRAVALRPPNDSSTGLDHREPQHRRLCPERAHPAGGACVLVSLPSRPLPSTMSARLPLPARPALGRTCMQPRLCRRRRRYARSIERSMEAAAEGAPLELGLSIDRAASP